MKTKEFKLTRELSLRTITESKKNEEGQTPLEYLKSLQRLLKGDKLKIEKKGRK